MTAGLVCTTMILTVGCAEQTVVKEQEAESLPVIVVGSDNYPPFNYLNADGDPTGIDVELAKEAFYRMGYEAEFKLINWEDKKEFVGVRGDRLHLGQLFPWTGAKRNTSGQDHI